MYERDLGVVIVEDMIVNYMFLIDENLQKRLLNTLQMWICTRPARKKSSCMERWIPVLQATVSD